MPLFEPWSDQTKDYKISVSCFCTKHVAWSESGSCVSVAFYIDIFIIIIQGSLCPWSNYLSPQKMQVWLPQGVLYATFINFICSIHQVDSFLCVLLGSFNRTWQPPCNLDVVESVVKDPWHFPSNYLVQCSLVKLPPSVQSVVWRYNEFGDKLRDIENRKLCDHMKR